MEELTTAGKTGALNWIRKFARGKNNSGRPLPEVLKRSGHYWYEMKPDTQADLVLGMNLADRIFIAKMRERGFVDQRLIRLTAKPDINVDVDLCHALLNSVLGLFLIEASGFGRGLGALDLNATKISRGLRMLNPNLLSEAHIENIKVGFSKLSSRKVGNILEELESSDRAAFDRLIFDAYGIEKWLQPVKNALKSLFQIRNSVAGDR